MAKKRTGTYSGKKLEEFYMEVDGLAIFVERKLIKYIHLKIDPEGGQVRVSIPDRVTREEIQKLIRKKWDWIQENRKQIQKKNPEGMSKYQDGDVFCLWGKPYTLRVKESPAYDRLFLGLERTSSLPGRSVDGEELYLRMELPSGVSTEERQELMDKFYRLQMKRRLPQLIARCEARTGLHAEEWRIRKMKTRWGSCNWKAGRIWLNLKLAAMDPKYMEYVMIHELCHLLEPSHNAHFYELMDQFLPEWKDLRKKMR